MKKILLIATALLSLNACVVAPQADPMVAPGTAPVGTVYVEPSYPAPIVGSVWLWNPILRSFGWHHPDRGWHNANQGWHSGRGNRR